MFNAEICAPRRIVAILVCGETGVVVKMVGVKKFICHGSISHEEAATMTEVAP
jgi:hypothetical protein